MSPLEILQPKLFFWVKPGAIIRGEHFKALNEKMKNVKTACLGPGSLGVDGRIEDLMSAQNQIRIVKCGRWKLHNICHMFGGRPPNLLPPCQFSKMTNPNNVAMQCSRAVLVRHFSFSFAVARLVPTLLETHSRPARFVSKPSIGEIHT